MSAALSRAFRDSSGVLDHNAHRVGLPLDKPFVCNGRHYDSLAALAIATGHEKHGIEIRDYNQTFVAAE